MSRRTTPSPASVGRLAWSSPVAASPAPWPTMVVRLVERGRPFFSEIACFTNGTFLTRELAGRLATAGLSYLCYSRHHDDDVRCRELMGPTAPTLEAVLRSRRGPEGARDVRHDSRLHRLCPPRSSAISRRSSRFGVREFTFKHTYVAYEGSVFRGSRQNDWAAENRVDCDPFGGRGEAIARLPWGPSIRRLGDFQVCYYYEPDPDLGKGAPVMPLDQPAVRRQRVRLAGGSPEPAVPVEHLVNAIQPDEVERFRPLLPVGYEAGVDRLPSRGGGAHRSRPGGSLHERIGLLPRTFRAALEGRARGPERRRLGPCRLRRLRRWFGRRFHDASGRGRRRARPRLPVPGRLVRLPRRGHADGKPGLGLIGPRRARMPLRTVRAKWPSDGRDARFPGGRSALPVEPESVPDARG